MIELIPTSDSVEHGVRVDALPGAQFLDHDPVVLIAGLPGLWLGPAAPYASERRGKFGEAAAGRGQSCIVLRCQQRSGQSASGPSPNGTSGAGRFVSARSQSSDAGGARQKNSSWMLSGSRKVSMALRV